MTAPQSAPMGEQELIALPKDTARFLADVMVQHWPSDRKEAEWFEMQYRLLMEACAAASPRLAGREDVFKAIDERLADLRNSNKVYAADSRLSAQDNIHRNDREIRFLRDLKAEVSLLCPAPSESVGWRDIESAQKDGTEVDLLVRADVMGNYWRETDCHFHKGEWLQWNISDESDYRVIGEGKPAVTITHWRAIPDPAPPTSHASQNRGSDE